MTRRFLCCTLAVLCLYSIFPCRILAVETSAASAILMDADSGRVLYEHNADRKMLIASTTKILTALVAIEEGDLHDSVKVSREAAYTEGSAMYLTEGEPLTLETLLYGVLLCSGNDAAVAVAQHVELDGRREVMEVAQHVGGSVKGFVALMNEKAQELGMEHSSFANPNGLDDEQHYSTARDMAKLARAALENETLMRIASTRSVTIGGRTMTNHNKLLHYVDGCLGLKTGYTKAAGRTLVSCAEKNGQRLIAVTLQDGNDWADHQALYEYGFSAYPARTCAVRGQALTQASVSGGVSPTVPLIAGAGFCYPAAETERLTTRICLDEPLRAPVSAGKTVGAAVFCLNGTEIGRVPLVAGRTVMPKVSSALAGLKLELKDE